MYTEGLLIKFRNIFSAILAVLLSLSLVSPTLAVGNLESQWPNADVEPPILDQEFLAPAEIL